MKEHAEELDIDLSVGEGEPAADISLDIETPQEEAREEKSEFTPEFLMSDIARHLEVNGVVSSAIYGKMAELRQSGMIKNFANGEEDLVVRARLGTLSPAELDNVAAQLIALREHPEDGELGARIVEILFPDQENGTPLTYELCADITGSETMNMLSTQLERQGNPIADAVYGELYEYYDKAGMPPPSGEEDSIIDARLDLISQAQRSEIARMLLDVDRAKSDSSEPALQRALVSQVGKNIANILFAQ